MFEFLKRPENKTVHGADMDSLIGEIEFIDIREPYEYQTGSIKTAKNIPMGNLLAQPEKYLTRDKTYYIICQSGGRSARAVKELSKQSFHVLDVAGGMNSYRGTMKQ
ncbi:MAG: rhodanese-like domain-containing protein [Lacrimispora sp.]|uniref:rhodanese-like domain-containing protein n=1 Tax=Lacrimispora sp. TaxID=2719234 RepID=UPI0039E6A67D